MSGAEADLESARRADTDQMEDTVWCLLSRFFDSQFRELRDVCVSCQDINRDVLATAILFQVRLVPFLVKALPFFGNPVGAVENFRIVCHDCHCCYCSAKWRYRLAQPIRFAKLFVKSW